MARPRQCRLGLRRPAPLFQEIERFELLADPKSGRHLRFGGKPLASQIDARFHGTTGPLNVAPLRSVNPMFDVYLEAAQQAGYPLNPDFNGARQNGIGTYVFTQRNGERQTAEGAYLDPVRHRPNLTVLSDRPVTRLVMEGKRAVGVAWRNDAGQGEIRGREIILSAGSFVSPQLLMLSGIGDARELARHGIPLVHDLPGVGENLQDHLDVTLEYRAKTTAPYGLSWKAFAAQRPACARLVRAAPGPLRLDDGRGRRLSLDDPRLERPDIQLFFCTAIGNTQNAEGFAGHGFLMHVCQLRPGSVGRLRLKSADPNEKPSILFNFFRGASTMDALREGIRIARRIVAQRAFAPHLDREVSPGPEAESDGALDAFIRQTVGTLFHPVGTCSMGVGPDAVVDPASLRVHGIEGLRVVDASIMPALVSANTVAATYCLAEKGADLMRRERDAAVRTDDGVQRASV